MGTFYDVAGRPTSQPPRVRAGLQQVLELRRPPELKTDLPPCRHDLAVMTCFYNPAGFQTLRRHYDEFAARCERDGATLFTIECAIGDQPFTIPAHDRVVRVRSRDVLWHKERLLNILAAKVPDQFTKLAWVDCDFEFNQGDWWERAALALEAVPVVQLFNELTYLDRHGKPERTRRSATAELRAGGPFWQCCPGGAWAAHRQLFDHYGLFDRLINGGGDSLAFHGFFGSVHPPLMGLYNRRIRAAFQRWAKPVWRYVRGQVDCLPLVATHHWHGDREKRGYNERIVMIRDFDPDADLEAGPDLAWQWRDPTSALAGAFLEYFRSRDEDGTGTPGSDVAGLRQTP